MIYVSISGFHHLLKNDTNLQLIDIREKYEYNICKLNHIHVHIPMGDIISRLKEINNNKVICILCETGKRSEAVANLLETDYGFEDIIVVSGGIIGYSKID